ncbi:MAG: bifunctional DNA primase/polymerase, partial [Alphaproteobacteria bacterium]|nr:bifunctional DNA primase/polymerase [Alphaproteobacteria bacterium]
TRKYADPVSLDDGAAAKKSAMQVELRSTGTMSVAPGSRHPSGETYRWDEDDEPGKPPKAELELAIVMLAVACLLANHYPGNGIRHDFVLALAGTLLRSGIALDRVRHLVETVTRYVGDEEWEDRVRCVEDTAQKLEAGEPVTGIPTVTDILDKKVADRIAKWLGFTVPERGNAIDERTAMNELNAKHAVVIVGGRTAILYEKLDQSFGHVSVELLQQADFRLLYSNRLVSMKDGTHVNLARHWLSHPNRRQYDQVVFEPGINLPGCYNLWRGFAVPAREGDWSLFHDHIRDVICNGDEGLYRYVLAFMADAVQNPRNRPGVVIALRGKQGTGKGFLWRELGALFKPHFLHVTHQHHFTGHFNSHMDRCLLLFVDEAYWAGDKVNVGYVKSLITDPTLIIEKKGKDLFPINNYIRIVIASNHDWVVPADLDDRRFCVIDVSDAHANDREYFKPIYDQMNAGGREAMLYDLQRYELSGVDLGEIPKTEARLEQQIRAADPFVQWWHTRLADGYIIFEELAYRELNQNKADEDGDKWPKDAPTGALHSDYIRFCRKMGARHPHSIMVFGAQLNKYCPGIVKAKIKTSHWYPDPDNPSLTLGVNTRLNGYKLPSLSKCRTDFIKVTGLNIDWGK